MDAAKRNEILQRAQAHKAQQAANPAPGAPPPAAAPGAAPKARVVRTTGGAEVRVVDPDAPQTQPRVFNPGGGVTARQAPEGPTSGRAPLGARIVNPEVPSTRVVQDQQDGVLGARIITPGAQVPGQQPAAPVPTLHQTLRTPLPAPTAPPAAPPQGPPPGGFQMTDELSAQVAALGAQQAAQAAGATPGAPIVSGAGAGVPQSPVAPPPAPAPSTVGASVGDVTAILSQHVRPDTLDPQYRALRAAGLEDDRLWVWVTPGGVKLNDGLIGRLRKFATNFDFGPYFRWSLTTCVDTKYVLIIDDDCTPGPQWLQLALQRLEQAEAMGQRIIISAAGKVYQNDAYNDVLHIGSQSLHRDEIVVDVGSGAWLMPTELARAVLAYPQIGSWLATPMHVAAAMQDAEAQIVVLPYIHNQNGSWGMLQAPRAAGSLSQRYDQQAQRSPGTPGAEQLRAADYDTFRHVGGWKPNCVAAVEQTQPDAPIPKADPPPSTNPEVKEEAKAEEEVSS